LNQTKVIPLSYADQIVEGTFEYALNEIVEEHLDLAVFEHRYHDDATGRSAYDPKVLLKVVLYGYYRGIISSLRIAEACRRNVVFMALSADSRPLESLTMAEGGACARRTNGFFYGRVGQTEGEFT
jgi:transposase